MDAAYQPHNAIRLPHERMLLDTRAPSPDALPAAVDVPQDDAWRAQIRQPSAKKAFTTANPSLPRRLPKRVAIAVIRAGLSGNPPTGAKRRSRKSGAHGAALITRRQRLGDIGRSARCTTC